MMWRLGRPLVAGGLLAVFACTHRPMSTPRFGSARGVRLEGVMSILPNTRFAALGGLAFGGVSGLAYDAARGELLGICDDSRHARIFRMRIRSAPLDVEPVGVISLEMAPGAPPRLDAEGLALLPDTHLMISSEGGGNSEPRVPPAVVEYTYDGRFVRQLPVPPKFLPTPRGRQTSGVRPNEAFESLTVGPDARRLYTATESALVQDGDAASFERSALSRVLEYERRDGGFVPAREFAYEVDAIPRPAFSPGLAINGLVELLALDDRTLLALERSYVEDASRPGRGVNRIRVYRVSLERATDISQIESLRDRQVTPVSKRLVLDLGQLPGLPDTLRTLDNFEGLALLPSPQAPPSLLIVSDDNFSQGERTWFVRVGKWE